MNGFVFQSFTESQRQHVSKAIINALYNANAEADAAEKEKNEEAAAAVTAPEQ